MMIVHASADIGGTELQTLELERVLQAAGFELRLLFDCSAGPLLELYEKHGLDYRLEPGHFWPSAHTRRWIDEFAPTVAYLLGRKVGLRWRLLLKLWRPQIRAIVGVRGMTNTGRIPWLGILMEKLAAPVTDAYVCNSRFVAAKLTGRLLPKEKMFFLPNLIVPGRPLSTDARLAIPVVWPPGAEVCLPDARPTIVCVANLRPVKGHRYLVEALRYLRAAGVDFLCVLIGQTTEGGNVLAGLERAGLREAVACTGFRHDVSEILARSDVFVLPSLLEGCPNAALEAMAAGLPVVTSPWGDQRWLIDDGRGGFVVDPRDTRLFADRIRWLLERADERRRFGEWNAKKVRREFDRNHTERWTIELFQRLTADSSHAT